MVKKKLAAKKQKKILATMRDNLCGSEDLIDMRTRKMVLNWI
jgi:hypothetical protein